MKKIFYNSSLPRSGSTLLQNIMAQNPDFYCTPTSGTLELIYGARVNYSADPTFKSQEENLDKAFQEFCKCGLIGYYDALTEKPFVLEKSRGWGIHYKLLEYIFQSPPKIICMVRDIKQILCSMEMKFRDNPQIDTGFVDHAKGQNTTTFKRISHYLTSPPLGLAVERLQEIFQQQLDSRILFVRYEDLCSNPVVVMNQIYNYLGTAPYENHDFSNIRQTTKEDDSVYGIFGDHKINPSLKLKSHDAADILGPFVCNDIDNNFQWFNQKFNYPFN